MYGSICPCERPRRKPLELICVLLPSEHPKGPEFLGVGACPSGRLRLFSELSTTPLGIACLFGHAELAEVRGVEIVAMASPSHACRGSTGSGRAESPGVGKLCASTSRMQDPLDWEVQDLICVCVCARAFLFTGGGVHLL